MKQEPQFSVITVCRNERKNIRQTCESICSQTFNDFEWIVIDGASTDGTIDVLAEYKDRITVLVSEADSGLYDAMNKGIALAKGQYLVFMNGGDQFAGKDVLQFVSNAPDADIIYGDILLDQDDGSMKTIRLPDKLPENFLLKKMIPHQSAYFRRGLFEKYGTYDTSYSIVSDYELFVRLIYVNRVSTNHLSMPVAVFKMDGVSSMSKSRSRRKSERHRVKKQYFPMYRYSAKAFRQTFREWIKRQVDLRA